MQLLLPAGAVRRMTMSWASNASPVMDPPTTGCTHIINPPFGATPPALSTPSGSISARRPAKALGIEPEKLLRLSVRDRVSLAAELLLSPATTIRYDAAVESYLILRAITADLRPLNDSRYQESPLPALDKLGEYLARG